LFSTFSVSSAELLVSSNSIVQKAKDNQSVSKEGWIRVLQFYFLYHFTQTIVFVVIHSLCFYSHFQASSAWVPRRRSATSCWRQAASTTPTRKTFTAAPSYADRSHSCDCCFSLLCIVILFFKISFLFFGVRFGWVRVSACGLRRQIVVRSYCRLVFCLFRSDLNTNIVPK
jgi:hypothetical protein